MGSEMENGVRDYFMTVLKIVIDPINWNLGG
jgi:hypothetical protein